MNNDFQPLGQQIQFSNVSVEQARSEGRVNLLFQFLSIEGEVKVLRTLCFEFDCYQVSLLKLDIFNVTPKLNLVQIKLCIYITLTNTYFDTRISQHKLKTAHSFRTQRCYICAHAPLDLNLFCNSINICCLALFFSHFCVRVHFF